MKKSVSVVLFLAFMLLCGAEIGPKFLASARKENSSVLYVKSAENIPSEKKNEPGQTDYRKLVEDINGNGA